MKTLPIKSRFIALLGVAALCSHIQAATVSVGTSLPTTNAADISNLGARTGGYSLWGDRPMQGQSFTTGADVGGYQLNSVTFIVVDNDSDPGPANLVEGWKDWRVRVSTFSGNTETPFFDENSRYNADFTDDNYITVTFDTPIILNPNTLYGFSMSVPNSQEGWQSGIPSLSGTGNDYAGGQRYQTQNSNSVANLATATATFNSGSDLVFHLDMTVIPEPGVALLSGLGVMLLLRRRK